MNRFSLAGRVAMVTGCNKGLQGLLVDGGWLTR